MSHREEQDPEENLVSRTVPPFRPFRLLAAHTSQYSVIAKLIAYIYAPRSSQLTPPHSFLHSRRHKQTRTLLRPTFPHSTLSSRLLYTSSLCPFDFLRPSTNTLSTFPTIGHSTRQRPSLVPPRPPPTLTSILTDISRPICQAGH